MILQPNDHTGQCILAVLPRTNMSRTNTTWNNYVMNCIRLDTVMFKFWNFWQISCTWFTTSHDRHLKMNLMAKFQNILLQEGKEFQTNCEISNLPTLSWIKFKNSKCSKNLYQQTQHSTTILLAQTHRPQRNSTSAQQDNKVWKVANQKFCKVLLRKLPAIAQSTAWQSVISWPQLICCSPCTCVISLKWCNWLLVA